MRLLVYDAFSDSTNPDIITCFVAALSVYLYSAAEEVQKWNQRTSHRVKVKQDAQNHSDIPITELDALYAKQQNYTNSR